MKGEAVIYSIAAIGVTVLLFLSSLWLGPIGAFANMLAAAPICYLVMRFGLKTGIMAVLLSAILLLQMADVPVLISYLGLYTIPALLLPALLRGGQFWDRALLISGVVTLLVAGVLLLSYIQLSGQETGILLDSYLQSEVDTAMQAYGDAGFSASQLANLKEVATQVADFIRKTFVGLYAAGVLVIHFVTLALVQRFRKDRYVIAGAGFAQWRLPAVLIWLLIVAGFSLLLPVPLVALAGRNLLAVLLPLYFIQGLAVVCCFLKRKSWPPALKGLIYVLVFLLNPLPLVVTGVGVFDLWIDFRRPRKKDL
ncbi:MAG: YybS family protein [Geopsychrobacter sp.]|nr:YybS family protein [Geopsychrobacter sp.]